MIPQQTIPLYDFTVDDARSVPFRFLPLEQQEDHDVSAPHRHNYYEIFIFLHGGGTHEIDFETYPIESNSLHWVSPGQVHQVRRSAGSFGKVLFFSRDFFMVSPQLENLLTNHPFAQQPILTLAPGQMATLMPILQAFEVESQQRDAFYEDVVRQYLALLLLECKRRLAGRHNTLTDSSYDAQLCQNFKSLLEKHFKSQHQVQAYAKLLGTTPKALNQALSKHTGQTASAHIFNRLTLEAKRLLRHSALSVKEIAFLLNYDDPAHFSKFFKAQTGLSPADFREG